MLKRKSPIAAIGLATGAMVLQPVWPAVQKFWQAINLSMANLPTLQTAWPAAQRFVSVELQAIWPVVQKSLENGYWHLSVANSWNYIVILAAVILEGPIATLLGGVWASTGRVNLWAVLGVAMLAGVLADSFWYYLGYFGREQVIARWGRYINVDLATIGKMERVLFGEQANRVIFSAKLTSALIIPTLIAAGLAKMGWRRVMRAMVMAQVLWTLGLTVVGFIAADSFMLISRKVEHFGWLAGGAIALLFAGRIVYRWRKYR